MWQMRNKEYEKWELGMWEIKDVRNEECDKQGTWEIVKEGNGKCEEGVRNQIWENEKSEVKMRICEMRN